MENLTYDLIIKSKDILVSDGDAPEKIQRFAGEIGILKGKILDIAPQLTGGAKETIDFGSQTVLPGIIDSQVHFRDPGHSHKEDFSSGTESAILGGVTAVFDMPNTKPNTSTLERYLEKLELCTDKAHCDFGLFVGATPDNSAELPNLENLKGCCGVKIFMGSSTGDLLVAEDEHLARALASGSRKVAVHCEDEHILNERAHLAKEAAHPRAHPVWRNVDSALNATQRVVGLAEKAGRSIQTLHITTAEELEFLRNKKDILTVECLPQHLFFSAPECYEEMGSRAQMNPPIREKRHQEALWKAISDRTVDVIGSDHAPHTLEEKARTYPASPSGMPGVQTILPVMLNFVSQGRLTLERMVELLSIQPARIYKASGKGGIYIGQDADFSVVDLDKEHTIHDSQMASRCGWTPYHGKTLKGLPTATIIRGQLVMRDGKVTQTKVGQPITFL